MNVSSLVNQQLSFALTLLDMAGASTPSSGTPVTSDRASMPNRFACHALIQSALLQWDLAIRYWIEEVVTSASASTGLKLTFANVKPIHELPLKQSLARVVQFLSHPECGEIFLERLISNRNDEGSWLFVLENAMASLSVSEKEWADKFDLLTDDHDHEKKSAVVMIASSSAMAYQERRHWRAVGAGQLVTLIGECKLFFDDVRSLNAEN